MRIVDIRERTAPIASPIANAFIDFSKMTLSLVAVVTDVIRDGRPVIGYGFNSNGRYGQGGLISERFAPRLLEADPRTLLDATEENLDPDRIWACMMTNEKPGGHGDRSVAVGTIDMAVWDAVAKIAGKPLFRLLAQRHGIEADPRVFVYAAGGYYYPGKNDAALSALVQKTFARLAEAREMRWLYEKWFLKRLPTGERLNIPIDAIATIQPTISKFFDEVRVVVPDEGLKRARLELLKRFSDCVSQFGDLSHLASRTSQSRTTEPKA